MWYFDKPFEHGANFFSSHIEHISEGDFLRGPGYAPFEVHVNGTVFVNSCRSPHESRGHEVLVKPINEVTDGHGPRRGSFHKEQCAEQSAAVAIGAAGQCGDFIWLRECSWRAAFGDGYCQRVVGWCGVVEVLGGLVAHEVVEVHSSCHVKSAHCADWHACCGEAENGFAPSGLPGVVHACCGAIDPSRLCHEYRQ